MAKSQQSPTKIAEAGARLREERLRLGMNQADFAALGGVSINSQTRYESGSGTADVAYLLAVGEKGADIAYVLTGVRSSSEITEAESELIANLRQTSDQFRQNIFAIVTAFIQASSRSK